MYRIRKTDLVLLCSRGKVHEIIHHSTAEDTDMEWSVIKKKLTSNYESTRSRIEASVKISKLSMNSEETVGKYLATAKTLVKSKIKDATSWNSDIDEADAYHVCNGLLKVGLKSRMLQRVSQFKTYKELFNNIEDKWERSYFMEDDFAVKEAEVNEVYHKYTGIPHSVHTGHPDPDHKTSELHSGEVEETGDHLPPGTTTLST